MRCNDVMNNMLAPIDERLDEHAVCRRVWRDAIRLHLNNDALSRRHVLPRYEDGYDGVVRLAVRRDPSCVHVTNDGPRAFDIVDVAVGLYHRVEGPPAKVSRPRLENNCYVII